MYDPNSPLLTLDKLQAARDVVCASPHYVHTPMIHNVQGNFGIPASVNLHMKLENMQVTGSFKIRGVINQLKQIPKDCGTEEKKLLCMSAGNYGKAFGYMMQKLQLKGMCLMPETAPMNRTELIQSFGVEVERWPSTELQNWVDKYVSDRKMHLVHSFDDVNIMAGHGSCGFEILEDCPKPDVVLVCCGGGGLVSGVASAMRLSGLKDCRIYGVEPEGSRTMYESFKAGKAVDMPVKSVASGLSPPYAGENAYRHCREHLTDILLVSDAEIVSAMARLYRGGLVVEPSGSAAFAALYHGKVPDVEGKTVVVVITGGNVSPEELSEHLKSV